ncbi:MAG TPA: DUF1232 domain-containing protein [Candidatus Methanofastidiosa archaeon]|nr:DUF1232 domain-containing protein [Candidatus Methanofastidiosa archaeon]
MYIDALKRLAKNPDISLNILELYAIDEDPIVRGYVASNPNTSLDILYKLARDEDPLVRGYVASNPNTSPDILYKLARDENPLVRGYVASNPNTTLDLLYGFTKDEDPIVRGYVASNPNTSSDILEKLISEDTKNDSNCVAKSPKIISDIFHELARDEDPIVRGYVARNPSATLDILYMLAKDEDPIVRGYVARNPSATPDIVCMLERDKNPDVRAHVASNPNAIPDTLEEVFNDEIIYEIDNQDSYFDYMLFEVGDLKKTKYYHLLKYLPDMINTVKNILSSNKSSWLAKTLCSSALSYLIVEEDIINDNIKDIGLLDDFYVLTYVLMEIRNNISAKLILDAIIHNENTPTDDDFFDFLYNINKECKNIIYDKIDNILDITGLLQIKEYDLNYIQNNHHVILEKKKKRDLLYSMLAAKIMNLDTNNWEIIEYVKSHPEFIEIKRYMEFIEHER